MYKLLTAFACCALFLLIFPMSVNADEWNKKTVVTFSAPVELPGITLPAGTYVFKLLDSPSDRHIVQVLNQEETRLYATILAIPDYRLTPSGKTVLRFEERPVGTPEALRAWFYPGDNFGQQFVYPKARATEIAGAAKVPVLSAEVTPSLPAEELAKAPVSAITPDNKEVNVAELFQRPLQEPLAVESLATHRPPIPIRELPKTASPLPLVALFGFLALGLAAGLRVFSELG